MRNLRGAMFALAMGTSALAGCSQGSGAVGALDVDPKSIEAHVAKLASETLKGTATTPAKMEVVRDMLPPEVSLTWGGLTFDAATNSTLVSNLKLTPKDMPTVGVQISELRLWDFDADLLKARISGQRLTETAVLARRVDAKGVTVFGLADAINASMSGQMPDDMLMPPAEPANPTKFQEQPADAAPQVDAPVPDDWPPQTEPEYMMNMTPPKIEKMDISLGRMIIDDVQVKPWMAAPAPAAPAAGGMVETAPGMAGLQQIVAFLQSYGIDTAAYFDYKISFAMSEPDMGDGMPSQAIAGDVLVKSMGARGMRGGDLDGMFIRDVSYNFKMAPPGASAPVDISTAIGLMTMKNLRLEKVLSYMIKGVVPPRTETNLLSLGVWRLENESMKLGGNEVYSIGEGLFDASGFHWFIPTKLQATTKNMTIDFEKFMQFAASQIPPADPAEPVDPTVPSEQAQMQAMIATLQKYGLSKPTFDTNFDWNWNADNGDTKLDINVGGKELLQVDARYEGAFPSFKAVSDVIPENPEMTDPTVVQKVFMSNSALKLIDLNVKDNGGLTKIYGLVGEFGPGMGMGNGQPMTADQVRDMAVQMVKMAADPKTTGIPELAALMNPVAEFLGTGGKLHIGVQPTKPMPFSSLIGTLMSAGMGSPAQAIKDIGLKVEHSK